MAVGMFVNEQEQEHIVEFAVKNTFLDLKRHVEAPVRRSSSVPRGFKPGDCTCCDWSHSDDSTNASDHDVTEKFQTPPSEACYESADEDSVCEACFVPCFVDPAANTPEETQKSRLTLSLSDMVTEGAEKVRLKLRSRAQPFKSLRSPPAEVMSVIANAVEVLSSGTDIFDVHVRDGGMGGTTMIVAKSSSTYLDALMTFSLVKDSLLHSAEQSENTYILGYGAQPFENLDPCSFSATIARVPAEHHDTACWQTYENGSCPCHTMCHWDHPGNFDMMKIIITLIKADSGSLVL